MPDRSAGLLLYRGVDAGIEVLLVHPGGPYWTKKDDGAWSIPKGLIDSGEDPLAAARREFTEETGFGVDGSPFPLGEFRQPSGKLLLAWAVEGDADLRGFQSNSFALEWPPRSGRMQQFPEVDRAGWFAPTLATHKVVRGQAQIIAALCAALKLVPP